MPFLGQPGAAHVQEHLQERSAIKATAASLSIALTAASGLAVAAVLIWRFSFRDPSLRATLETALVLTLLVSAWLLRGRLVPTRLVSDSLTPVALLMLALADLGFMAGPQMLGMYSVHSGVTALLFARLLVGASFAAAALAPYRAFAARGRRPAVIVGMAIVSIVGLGIWALLFGHSWGNGQSHASVSTVDIVLAAGSAALQLLAAAAFVLSAVRRGQTTPALLGASSILLAGAWLYSVVPPVVSSGFVSGSIILRIAATGLLLAAASGSCAREYRRAEDAAAARERRRLALDLHDGLAQDLAFIAAHGERLAKELGSEHPIAIAARRALATSRGAIADLSAAAQPTTEAALRAIAAELSARYEVQVVVNADDIELSTQEREELVRIAREAIMNAVEHGKARQVIVSLRTGVHRVVLRVTDDGAGIGDLATSHPQRGFGMRAMGERAEAVGGRLLARHGEVGGTEIKVVV